MTEQPLQDVGVFSASQRPAALRAIQPLRAGIYTRVSKDDHMKTSREGTSTASQEQDSHEVLDTEGWTLTRVYCDNNISASPYSEQVRDDWDELLADIASGEMDVLVAWESSRGSRRLSEWAVFLELLRDNGVLIYIVTHGQLYDPRKKRHWKILADDGVNAEYASHETSDRVKRLKKAMRGEGRPDGKIPYGFRREYDPETGELLGQYEHPERGPAANEIIERLSGGDSLVEISKDFNLRTQLPRKDPQWLPLSATEKPYRPQTIRYIAMLPALIGKLKKTGTADLLPAAWDPIVDEAEWHRVQGILKDPERRTSSRPGRVRHLLSNISLCSKCGSRLLVRKIAGEHRYSCSGRQPNGQMLGKMGCTSIVLAESEKYVIASLALRFCDKQSLAALTNTDNRSRIELQGRADDLRAEVEDSWKKAFAREPGFTRERAAQHEAAVMPEILRLEKEAVKDVGGAGEMALILLREAEASGLEGSELQEAMVEAIMRVPLPGRRQMVVEFLGPIVLHPAKRKGRQPYDGTRFEFNAKPKKQ